MTSLSLLVRVTAFSHLHCRAVVGVVLILASLAAGVAAQRLGVSTDTDAMFAANLGWRQRQMAMDRDFPQFRDLLVAVVRAQDPEAAETTAAGLVAALTGEAATIRAVRRPDADPFLERAGLLFLDQAPLSTLLEQTIDAQPFLGQLAADPSARGLFAALALMGMGVARGQADISPFIPALAAFHQAMAGALAGRAAPLSWARLLGGEMAALAGPYRFVLIQPQLDFASLTPGGAATERVRAAIAGLEFVRDGSAQVRLTGPVALADEEFSTVAEGAVLGLVASVLMITLWLFLAVRSWRLIVPILLTLGVGLAFTLLFAALAVGTLNLVSVGFGVLFVGIAVDFAIQFAVRTREARHDYPDPAQAILAATQRSGGAILVAALAIAAGFLAFVPTDFAGVAELGLIAGIGMLIAFACTLGFLPAAITLFRPMGEEAEIGFVWAARCEDHLLRARWAVLAGFAALAGLGAILVPGLRFDADPLSTKNQSTEAVRTLRALIDAPQGNPYSIDIMAADAAAAGALAVKLRALPLVAEVISIHSFLPDEQAEKLALIREAAGILGPTLAPRAPAAPITAADIRMAAATALGPIDQALTKLPQDQPVAKSLSAMAADLRALVAANDAVALAVNAALTRHLPAQIARLRELLGAKQVVAADIPATITRDWLAPDGRARVQVMAKPAARDSAGLAAFTAQVRALAPEAGGAAVTVVEAARTIVGAFRSASLWALVALAVLLLASLRRLADVALVLAPLLLAASLTVLALVLGGMSLNFANIIALPLLLGLGVSFNIYFVANWRMGQADMLGSATARAVLFSALTTGSAFGSLALSAHPGTASMGVLLLISLGCTLISSFAFLPALLAVLGSPQPRPLDETP